MRPQSIGASSPNAQNVQNGQEERTIKNVQLIAGSLVLLVMVVATAVILTQCGGLDCSLRSVVSFMGSTKGLPFMITIASVGGLSLTTFVISTCLARKKPEPAPTPLPIDSDSSSSSSDSDEEVEAPSQATSAGAASLQSALLPGPLSPISEESPSQANSAESSPAATVVIDPTAAASVASAAPGAGLLSGVVVAPKPAEKPPLNFRGAALLKHVQDEIIHPILHTVEEMLLTLIRAEHSLNKSSKDLNARITATKAALKQLKAIYPRLLTNRTEALRGLFMTSLDSKALLVFLRPYAKGDIAMKTLVNDHFMDAPNDKDPRFNEIRLRLLSLLVTCKESNVNLGIKSVFEAARKAFDELTELELKGKTDAEKNKIYATCEHEFVKAQMINMLMQIIAKIPRNQIKDLPDELICYILDKGLLKNELERLGKTSGLLGGLDDLLKIGTPSFKVPPAGVAGVSAKQFAKLDGWEQLRLVLEEKLKGQSFMTKVHVKGLLGNIKWALDKFGSSLAPGYFTDRTVTFNLALAGLGFIGSYLPSFSDDDVERAQLNEKFIAGVKGLITHLADSLYHSLVNAEETPFRTRVRGIVHANVGKLGKDLEALSNAPRDVEWPEIIRTLKGYLKNITKALKEDPKAAAK